MLKREQIPATVLEAAEKAHAHAWVNNDGDWWLEDTIAAAINAWPGMGPIRTDQPIGDWCDKLPAIILPLPQEKTDDEA